MAQKILNEKKPLWPLFEQEKGKSYGELADTYVIFICNFDPLGQKNAVIPSADTVKKREMYLVTESALFFLIQMEKIVRKYQRNW